MTDSRARCWIGKKKNLNVEGEEICAEKTLFDEQFIDFLMKI